MSELLGLLVFLSKLLFSFSILKFKILFKNILVFDLCEYCLDWKVEFEDFLG